MAVDNFHSHQDLWGNDNKLEAVPIKICRYGSFVKINLMLNKRKHLIKYFVFSC